MAMADAWSAPRSAGSSSRTRASDRSRPISWSRCPSVPCSTTHRNGILRSFEASQHRLGLVKPDIPYIHDIGRAQHGERHDHYWQQLTAGGGFRALERLRHEGAVTTVGFGVNEWEIVADALDVFDLDVTMLAGRYTLLEQAAWRSSTDAPGAAP